MGAVYRAWDNETRREVTLKTLLDVHDRTMLDLFYKECRVLASLNHPNIVDIYDVGEMEMDGGRRPYFVMPLLPGVTLDKLIAEASPRLTVEVVVDMIAQACRGLHAAHERGLVHRDIKPSNLFILDDDSVKIIDFGVAHLVDARTSTTLKGTLHYMAPEQIAMQKPTALSDVFSVGAVAYQSLTRRRPFEGATMDETIQAILHRHPPAASDLNPAVNRALSQVIHKAMAKQPFHRFTTARDFAENLLKALHGEPIESFDDTRILPRVQRAQKALDAGDYDFANEAVAGLEAEGFLHGDITSLRRQVDQAMRARNMRHLAENARRYLAEEEYQLALQKTQELLQLDPHNADGLGLKAEIESRRSSEQVGRWLKLARQHAANHAYSHARQALDNVLELRADDTQARQLLAEIAVREQEFLRARKEKEDLYQSALEAWQRGEVSSALASLERVLDLVRQAGASEEPERASLYSKLYDQVRSEHDSVKNAYDQARAHLASRDFAASLALCDQYLARYPGHALFQALKVDVEEQRRQEFSAFVARIDKEVEGEPDLDKRLAILDRALEKYPGESHFERARALTRSKRDLVQSIVGRARDLESKGHLAEAVTQWETLRSIYPAWPGLDFEMERLAARREQQSRMQAEARSVEQIDAEALARQSLDRSARAGELAAQGRELCSAGQLDQGLAMLREAYSLDSGDPRIRAALIDTLLLSARSLVDSDWQRSSRLVKDALAIDSANAVALSLRTLIEDRRRVEFLDQYVARARQFQAADDLEQALDTVNQAMAVYPQETRLLNLRASLDRSVAEAAKLPAAGRPSTDEEETIAAPATQLVPKPALKPAPPPVVRKKKRPLWLIPVGAVALIALVAVGVMQFRSSPPPPPPVVQSAPPPAAPPPPIEQPQTPQPPEPQTVATTTPPRPLPSKPAPPQSAPSPGAPTVLMRLIVRGATPGAQVMMDGRVSGAADAQGNFIAADLAPGPHNVELRLKGYRSRSLVAQLRPNQETYLDGALERMEAVISFSVEPSNASLQIQQTAGDLRYEGTNPLSPLPPHFYIPAGAYNLIFSAPGYQTETINVDLPDKRHLPLSLRLQKR